MAIRNVMVAMSLACVALGCVTVSSCAVIGASGNDTHQATSGLSSDQRPNVLLIVADDLGFSDLGVMGSEIRTPNIDKLANDGLLMTNFYAGGTCSPTRAMLLTGIDHHRAGIGNMMEHIAPNQVGQPGYEGYPNEHVVTLPELLRDAGYQTYATGKWHLGMTPDTSPKARGFDKSFMLMNGGASHFDQSGLNPMTHPAPYREDGVTSDLPADFDYSTDFYTRRLIEYIDQGRENDKPFFAYLAYTAPHWPLQAHDEDIAKYEGVYDGGWQHIQENRRQRMITLGLIPESSRTHPIVTDVPAWTALSAGERRTESRKMEVYAAMVDRVDQKIGELIQYLKETGQYDNTVIIFMSDNGAEGAPLYKLRGFQEWMNRFDNRFDNLGKAGSYVYYEERWAQVSMTPFRLYKGMATEGGVHVPAFISYQGVKNQGARHSSVTSVMDIAPTILDMANVPFPNGTYRGKAVYEMQGRSWLPVLNNDSNVVRSASDGHGWELFNKKGYRRGKWKAVSMHEPFGTATWQLYDLNADPGEINDLADQHPNILEALVVAWDSYAEDNGVIIGNTPPDR